MGEREQAVSAALGDAVKRWPRTDMILPFRIEAEDNTGPALTGRLTRLGPVADRVLRRHDYPEPVARLLGEALALTATLAGALKFDGVFKLQIQGDGPVSLVVTDATSDGALRGYARFDDAKLALARSAPGAHGLAGPLLGEGHLALTVDQGEDFERYQGVVDIAGDTLAECARHYFRQSQQMDAAIMLAADRAREREPNGGAWRAAGMMVQRVAGEGGHGRRASDDGDDPWRRAMLLLATSTQREMLDPGLAPAQLLFNLFHEDGVRVQTPRPIAERCRCSEERVVAMLAALPAGEVDALAEDRRVIEVTCEFCSRRYEIAFGALNRARETV